MADDFESKIAKHHEERKEHDLAVQNAQAHQNRSNERTDSALSRDNELSAETTSRDTGECFGVLVLDRDIPFHPKSPLWRLIIDLM